MCQLFSRVCSFLLDGDEKADTEKCTDVKKKRFTQILHAVFQR